LASVTHPAVRANILADRGCVPEYLPPEPPTRRIPAESMSMLVYGPRRRPLVSRQVAFRAALLGAVIGLFGCATGRRLAAPEAESVGQLAAGPSVWHAPTHASTDLAPAFQAVEGDDSAGEVVTTVSRAADAGGDAVAELPEVAPKTDGVTTGAVR